MQYVNNIIVPYIKAIREEMDLPARGFGSVVKHLTADPGIASSIPPHSN